MTLNSAALKAAVDRLLELAEEIEGCAEGAHAGINSPIAAMRGIADRLRDLAALPKQEPSGWMPIDSATDQDDAPWDGKPVLIVTNNRHGGTVHRAIWTDCIHGHGIFGWAVEDCKFGPYALRGYTIVSHWQPLPQPPKGADHDK